MRLQDITSSKLVTQFGLTLAQHIPPWAGYGLARVASNSVARRKPEIYWTVQANLRHVLGPAADKPTLHEMTRQVLFHAVQTYYDFFHTVGQPPEVLSRAVRIPESLIKTIRSETSQGRGLLLLGIHMSNFDLAILALGSCGFPVQALSLADPGEGFRMVNQLRAEAGFDITPITSESLREAVRGLRNGRMVATAVDWPVPRDQDLVEFFGRPAYLPLGPARLALMARATVILGSCCYEPEEGYELEYAGPIEMVRTGDRQQDVLTNTRKMAAIAEEFIRARPEQWMMFHPFWPDSPD